MAFNILEKTRSTLGKRTVDLMAGLLEIDEESMESVISLAIPALISGLIKKAQSPAGANELFEMIQQYDGSMLGNLGGLLTGGQHTMLIEMGQKILDSVFGDKLASVVSTVGKQVGLDSDKAGSMMGMLAPILISVLGKQKKGAGWDVDDFTSALSVQKELLSKVDPPSKRTTATGKKPSPARADRDSSTADPVTQGNGSLLKIVVPLLAIIVLVFLAWKFLFAPPAP